MLRARHSSTRWASQAAACCRPHPLRRGYASVTDLARFPKPGEQLHGFTVKRAKHVPELELTALHLQHDKTGADYLHVARDDTNNVFSIGFKTNPPDDTGVPHILEHTTLCGSEKYPVRDPFFKMLPRTLSNFMNAFTSADHTTYPFATTNAQDFKNLLSVYMDATLHPILNAKDFAQEGWRIGPEDPLAEEGADGRKLVFKGVVYNEMKGQMSDAGYLYYIRFQDHIFPSIHNSGGDPQKITDLTHEQLTKFHADHYHPSNAKVFTYGNMPLEDHLKEIGERLDKFNRIQADRDIREPISLSDGPKSVTVSGPVDPLVPQDAQYKTSTTWLVGDSANIQERFAMGVISSLLADGYGSPLYRNLIEAGLGTDWAPNTGLDGSGKVGIFSIGLVGVKEADVTTVKEAIVQTFQEAKENGFDKIKVDGILHQLELSLKHKTANFGMNLMQRLKPGWFNGTDPFEALEWNSVVSTFKEKYAAGGYLEGLIDKYLLNDNTLTFTMEPSSKYGPDLVEEEQERLTFKINETNQRFQSEEEAKKYLEERELELLEVQEAARNQDLSCLPTVHVKDIPRQKEHKPLRFSEDNTQIQWREAPTNGLTYFRAVNLFENLPDELRQLVPLFADSIMRLGTKDKSMEQLEELIKLKTGGVSVGYHVSPRLTTGLEEGLSFSGYALNDNVPAMYELLHTLVLETDFDGPTAQQKIRQLLQSAASGAMDSIAEAGHAYARRYAESGITTAGRYVEQTSGLSQVQLTTKLASRSQDEDLTDVIEKLKKIQSIALSNAGKFRAAITNDASASKLNESHLQRFLSGLTSTPTNFSTASPPNLSPNIKTFFPLPYQVYYSGLALNTAGYDSPLSPPLAILSQLLTHKHLHHEIREKGGAYGGGAYHAPLSGVFGMYSYRDPNPQNTLNIMKHAGRWAVDKQWKDEDLESAKLSIFQRVDAPESVSQEGMDLFLNGITDEMEQRRRERMLDVTAAQVKEVAEKFLINDAGNANVVVLGQKKDWVKTTDGWQFKDLGISEVAPSEEDSSIVGSTGAEAATMGVAAAIASAIGN